MPKKLTHLEKLRIAQLAIEEAIAFYHQAAGAQGLREALEHLLLGTPFEKPVKYDDEGLYGRVRAAICAGKKPVEAQDAISIES